MSERFRIAVLISGGGTTLENLIRCAGTGNLNASISQVISSNTNAAGNRYASDNEIPLEIIDYRDFRDESEFSRQIFSVCDAQQIELVVLGGFLRKLIVPERYMNRVINIHPSLIPAFSGKGYYGMKVHQAVVEFGCKISGCTVHFVDNQYDHGPILSQASVIVDDDDTPETLQKRVFEVECKLYPEVINQLAEGRFQIDGRQITRRF